MVSKVLIAIVCLIGFSYNVEVDGKAQLTLSVYYETLCPDSIRFITTRLYSNYLLLGGYGNPYLEIDFVPYGKANTTETSPGNYSFVCQHGPRECEGNKVHACALKHFPADRSAEFIYCSMKSSAPPEAGPACAAQLELDLTPVLNCLTSDGPGLLAELGNRTHSLQPSLYYVPWIVYNSVFTEEDLWDSQQDFLSVICKKLREGGNGVAPACNLRKAKSHH